VTRAALLLLFLALTAGPAFAQGSFGALKEGAASTEEGVRRAILIGIDEYDDPALSALRFAAKDAADLAAVLTRSEYGGFSSVEVVVDGDLTALGIVARLEVWRDTLAPADLGVVYFSGHGTRWLDETNRSHIYLATSDTKRDYPLASSLPMDALREFVETLPALRRVLIVDACFTGAGKVSAATQEAAADALVDEQMPFPDRPRDGEAQLFATTYGKPAAELDALQNGAYTHHLVEALGARFDDADINADRVVSVAEAHDWARDATMQATSEIQAPMIQYRITGRETLILSGDPNSRERARMAMVTSYEGPQQGLRLFVDGEEKGAFPRTLLVEPGPHKVEFRTLADKVVDRGRVTLKPEGVYSVRKLRDALNGGRHFLSAGYAHTWLPGEAWRSETVPDAPGVRLGYEIRFPSRNPVGRMFGISADLSVSFFGEEASAGDLVAPPSVLLDLGAGPRLRLPLGPVYLQVGLRAALLGLFRSEYRQPFTHWIVGASGADAVLGVRPVPQFAIQIRYQPMLFLGDLKGVTASDEGAPMNLLNRIVGGVEIGF